MGHVSVAVAHWTCDTLDCDDVGNECDKIDLGKQDSAFIENNWYRCQTLQVCVTLNHTP